MRTTTIFGPLRARDENEDGHYFSTISTTNGGMCFSREKQLCLQHIESKIEAEYPVDIIGSCDRILLLQEQSDEPYMLCSPLTEEFKILPPAQWRLRLPIPVFTHMSRMRPLCTFANLKVVRTIIFMNEDEEDNLVDTIELIL
ncbi:F-box protein [Striga asiatica]|uniref:F-box protein n=1 Tax=Striga asiatica TaxID=4170 RepID=A0A5A7PWC6_STRAF|nr:F-box protein [Striga asiatica]